MSITAHCGFCEVQIAMRIEDVDGSQNNFIGYRFEMFRLVLLLQLA
jgi:hypothetical protein